MKKLSNFWILALVVVAFGTITSCSKKGDDDPFLSFKSRDSRLAGEWTLIGIDGSAKTVATYNGKTTETSSVRTYSGKEETITPSKGNPTTRSYTLSLVIDKDGIITYTTEGFDLKGVSTGISTIQGTWNWETTAKHKSAITIDVSGPGVLPLMGTWNISQLKNKEIVFSKSSREVTSNSTSNTEITSSLSVTFIGK